MASTPLFKTRPDFFSVQPAHATEATRIADGIYVSEGLSHSYLIATPEGRVVINTGMGFEAPVHKRCFDAVDRGPVRYILLTQGHVDHVGGVDLFRETGTEIVAHENNAAHQADDLRIHAFRMQRSAFAFGEAVSKFVQSLKDKGGSIPQQSRPTPTITFRDRFEFELGGIRFELLSTPGGETTDSLVVWLPRQRVCFAGNLFSALVGHFPNLVTLRGDRYREALRFIESVDRVIALEPEILLVGHHGPIHGRETIHTELVRIRDAVQYVHDGVVAGMNAGRDVLDLMREIALPPGLEIGEGYGKVSWSVRAIWETYAGWFHHRSTTELYPVPPTSVHADLVELAGGPDAIARRAQEKVAKGQPVEAIHLAEVALAASDRHRGAMRASLDAHRTLLSRTKNFWETKWLEHQIAELEAKLGSGPGRESQGA